MEKIKYEIFKNFCVEYLPLLENIELPTITMHNDYEAVLVYFFISPHIEFILKNTILRLGNKWSYTIVCCSLNHNFIYSICAKISENIKIIKVNNVYDISKDVNTLFYGEKLLFYNENSLIINDNIYDFLHWDYIGSKIIYDKYDSFPFGGFSLLSKSFASNFNDNIGNPELKIADIGSFAKFVSINSNNNDVFAYHNYWYYNDTWKQDVKINKYSLDGLYNPTHYKILNIDLQYLTKSELLNHFKNFGYYEKKCCYIKNKETHKYITEYCDFDIEFNSQHYKHYNPELSELTSLELLKHYNLVGKHQNKTAFNKTLEIDYMVDTENPLVGNCVIFINNSHEVNDETMFLYNYVLYLQDNNIHDNILILDVIFNSDLFNYYSKLKLQPLFHCNNFTLMRELLDYYNPKSIYANGLNYLTLNITKFSQSIIRKTIFHFHNSMELIPPIIKNLKENTIYCSHEKINEHLYNSYGLTNTQVFRPFIRKEPIEKYVVLNLFGNNNIIFGMVGKNNYENGYDIFINLVKNLPQYNFVWVGGGDYDSNFSADNYIQICNYIDIYKYINCIDYLLVTCRNKTPSVVYKALYNNCPCIILENKMTDFIDVLGYYILKEHNNDYNKIIEYINGEICLVKKSEQQFNTTKYITDNHIKPCIKSYFSPPLSEITQTDNVVDYYSTPYFNWKHYLILHDDLIYNNIVTYEAALNHWLITGDAVENRKGIIREFKLEKYLSIYSSLKEKINDYWEDAMLEDLIKTKCNQNINYDKYVYQHYCYSSYANEQLIKIKTAVFQWIFNDNNDEIDRLPKKNGFIDLSCFGIDKNSFDVKYFLNLYRNSYFKPNNLNDSSRIWNIFGKTNNYISSVYSEIYEDVNFDWEYYIHANNLEKYDVRTKQDAFLHWNKYGKKFGLVPSNVTIKSFYNDFLKSVYSITATDNTKTKYVNSIHDSNINEKEIFWTKINNDPAFRNLKQLNSIDDINGLFLIVDFPNLGGGTTSFINRVISMYKDRQTFLIARNFKGVVYFYINDEIVLKTSYNEEESVGFINSHKDKFKKIFINSIIGHRESFINELFLLGIPVDTITHDYSLLYNSPQDYFHKFMKTLPNSYFPIHKCNTIFTQNIKNLSIYGSHIDTKNVIASELPDYKNQLKKVYTKNKTTIIGVIGNINNLKGYYIVEQLIRYSKKNKSIKVIIFGNISHFDETFVERYPYESISQLNELLVLHKPNVWIETTLWPETYSFTLTLMMITGLPIFYQKKPYPSVIENRLSTYKDSYGFDNIDELLKNMNMVIQKKQNHFYTIEPVVYFNDLWDSYFGDNIEKSKSYVNDITTYCIYFPQFHSFPENDKNFYKGFTDIKNLDHFIKHIEPTNTFTPSKKALKLDSITDYDLANNKDIIQTQFDIIKNYPINGFAIYYYWFSLNTVSNNNMIMGKVIDRFFEPSLDTKGRKVFFIWANEDWTKNVAFGVVSDKIENHYTLDNINKNADNLMKYFKHDNYLKIDNMPVFFIHHPWFMTDEELELTKNTMTNMSIDNGFSGIHFIINSMIKKDLDYLQYDFHFDYKQNKNGYIYINDEGKRMINYKKYIDIIDYNTVNIKALCFDFDNRPRLCLPDRIKYASVCEKNTEENQRLMIKQTIESYETSYKGINKILLINSWNEWGERLAIEPSNEMGYYYLDLLTEYLKTK